MQRRFMVLISTLALMIVASPGWAQSQLYQFYRSELSRTADGPTVSRSVWAGRFLPAAWKSIDRSGVYIDWVDDKQFGVSEDFSTVFSAKALGFSARHQSGGGQAGTDYTLGLSLGNSTASFGLGYGWQGGSDLVLGNSERLILSTLWRTRWTSLSWMNAYDLDRYENIDHFSLGARPFGPRWTIYGDYLGWRNNPGIFNYSGYDDGSWGYGLDAAVWPGVSFGIRGDDDGQLGVRVSLGFDAMRPSATYRADTDGDHAGTTWAFEFTSGPSIRDALPGMENYPQMNLRGPITYRRYGWFDNRPRFLSILAQINAMSEDPSVDGVVINMSGLQTTPANLWELRAQLAGLRERGKTVSIYLDRVNVMSYAFATVADEIWIDPMGTIDLRGINFGRSYYKETLAKVGVGFDEWRFFKYKSAVEVFSRTEFSEGAREQLAEVMNDFWGTASDLIQEARGLTPEALMDIVNSQSQILATEAEGLGLVDAVGDYNDLVKNAPAVKLRAYRGGQIARLGPLLGDRVWRQEEWSELPQIAVLYAIGPCAMDSGINGRKLSKMIRKVRNDPRVKAVVLRADSPGGDPLPSDLVSRELRETAKIKPVIVSQGQVAGSGGYWISMFGDKILASPLTITGSIGVISAHVYDDGLADKIGIDYDHMQIGRSADIDAGPGLPGGVLQISHRPVTTEERARAEEVIMSLYDDFVTAVAEGRGLERDKVAEISQGRIYTGLGGMRNGLVDEIGGLWDAIVLAKEAAGLPPSASIDLLEGPKLGKLPADLFKPSLVSSRVASEFRTSDSLASSGATVGMDAEAAVRLSERPEYFSSIFSVEQWAAMSTVERAWMRQVFLTPRQPITMIAPFNLGNWVPAGMW
jgi:protease-4